MEWSSEIYENLRSSSWLQALLHFPLSPNRLAESPVCINKAFQGALSRLSLIAIIGVGKPNSKSTILSLVPSLSLTGEKMCTVLQRNGFWN